MNVLVVGGNGYLGQALINGPLEHSQVEISKRGDELYGEYDLIVNAAFDWSGKTDPLGDILKAIESGKLEGHLCHLSSYSVFDTKGVINPTNEYGQRKMEEEINLRSTLDKSDYTILRVPTPVSPYLTLKGRGLFYNIAKATQNSPVNLPKEYTMIRDFVRIDKLARVALLTSGTYNVASGVSMSVRLVGQKVCDATNTPYQLAESNDISNVPMPSDNLVIVPNATVDNMCQLTRSWLFILAD